MRNKNGFTLVELIVVITILSILGTIAFLSMQGYSSNARDSNRTTDLGNIQTSLELYITKTGKYPEPSNGLSMSYSGGLVWNQGTFGNEPFRQLGDINKLPIDPLTGVEYTYSVTNNKTEYEIGGVYEGGISKKEDKRILKETYAEGNLEGTTKIVGTYNGVSLYLSTGSYNFTIFTPSIINSDITDVDVESIITNNKLSINGKNKLPSSYQNSIFKDIPIELGITEIVISTGSLGDLRANTQSGKDIRKEYITKLQSILSGSTLKTSGIYSNISNLDVDSTNSDLIAMSIITGKGVVGNSITSTTQNTTPTECTTGITELTLSNGQTWSCMNLGATEVWDGTSIPNNCGVGSCYRAEIGYFYQYGKSTPSESFTPSFTTWLVAGADDWGNVTNTNVARQGPCPNGWHVPTKSEWISAFNSITGGSFTGSTISINNLFLSKLKLSKFNGWLGTSDGGFQGSSSAYWTSNIVAGGFNSDFLWLGGTNMDIHGANDGNGNQVRCIKN